MIGWLRKKITTSSRNTQDEVEREKIARIEEAEKELASLTERGINAVGTLISRDKSNHWRESIEQMISGRAS